MRTMRKIILGIIASIIATPALAQSSPGLVTGQVPTAAQWNSFFAAKQDVLGFVPLNRAGGVMLGPLITVAPSASATGFRLVPGTAPTSPVNGDLWMTSAGMFYRIGGVTIPISGASSSSFSATSPMVVTFPAGVVNYAFNFGVANTFTAAQTFSAALTYGGVTLANSVTGTGSMVLATAPSIVGGTHTAITSLGIRSTGAAFDLTFATAEAISAGRTLSWVLGNANRSITLSADVAFGGTFATGGTFTTAAAFTQAGAFATTITSTATTNSTLPAGTHTLAGLDVAQTFSAEQTFSLPLQATGASGGYSAVDRTIVPPNFSTFYRDNNQTRFYDSTLNGNIATVDNAGNWSFTGTTSLLTATSRPLTSSTTDNESVYAGFPGMKMEVTSASTNINNNNPFFYYSFNLDSSLTGGNLPNGNVPFGSDTYWSGLIDQIILVSKNRLRNDAPSGTGTYVVTGAAVAAAGSGYSNGAHTLTLPWNVTAAAVAAGGAGYTNGTQTLTVTGVTCDTAPQVSVTVAGNVVVSINSVTVAGSCLSDLSNPVATSGGGGAGATLTLTTTCTIAPQLNVTVAGNVVTAVNSVAVAGSCVSPPTTFASSPDGGTGATFTISTWNLIAVDFGVIAGYTGGSTLRYSVGAGQAGMPSSAVAQGTALVNGGGTGITTVFATNGSPISSGNPITGHAPGQYIRLDPPPKAQFDKIKFDFGPGITLVRQTWPYVMANDSAFLSVTFGYTSHNNNGSEGQSGVAIVGRVLSDDANDLSAGLEFYNPDPASTSRIGAGFVNSFNIARGVFGPGLSDPGAGVLYFPTVKANTLIVTGTSSFTGTLQSVGANAGFAFDDRTVTPTFWVLYADNGVVRLNNSASGLDLWTMNTSGKASSATLEVRGSTSGATLLTPAAVASGTLTLPAATDTLVGRNTTDTLTNKTLTQPQINGGAAVSLTVLSIRSTGAAFDVRLRSIEALSADRILTLNMADADRNITLSGNLSVIGNFLTSGAFTTAAAFTQAGAFATTITSTATTNSTLPAGTHTLAGITNPQTWSAIQQYNSGTFLLNGSSSGTLDIRCAAACGTSVLTFPAGSTNFSGTGAGVVQQATTGSAFTVTTVANAFLATAAAYTLKGNATGSTASVTDFTIAGLTTKASPAASDYIMISDEAASSSFKKATISSLAGASGVASIDTRIGAFTTANCVESTAGNVIQLTSACRTLPTAQTATSGTSATYTTPANVKWINIRLCGGGGGGGGGGTGAGNGVAGGNSTFSTLTAVGGGFGSTFGAPGAGGGGSGGSVINAAGSSGMWLQQLVVGATGGIGGNGGATPFLGGAGAGGGIGSGGSGGATNTGGGGGGGGHNAAGSLGGSGGGAGGCVEHNINTPAATYTYTIGAGGAGGAAGTSGGAGGNGAAGYLVVVEYYNS